MRFFDLHCDTLYRVYTESLMPNSSLLSVSPEKAEAFEKYSQLMAVWIPDSLKGEAAFGFFLNCLKIFESHYAPLNSGKINFMLSVENGSVIGGDVSKIPLLKNYGVKAVTLVYDDNELGCGAFTASRLGLTDTGRKAVKELEKNEIYVDLSHSCIQTFFDVAEIASKPIIATHSNSFSICPHKRNLTDEQFEIIKKSGGIVGVNFYPPFLNPQESAASVKDVLNHIYHFLALGGENTVCIGSDYDGCQPLKQLNGIDKIPFLYDEMLKNGFNEQVIQKILYTNAHNFFT